jgi:HTH-type transcriptional regulator, transcriptional repressor of NAD biosynthesis genes
MEKRVGLVVGKFSPLHAGHEALINFAQDNCDELYVISYSNPIFSKCNPRTRCMWLCTRFPKIKVIVLAAKEVHTRLGRAPFETVVPPNDAPDDVQRRYLKDLLERLGVKPTVMFSGEEYGAPCAEFLGIEHMYFERQGGISGTAIRSGIMQDKCSPIVCASLVTRVAILGPESSGKSTLAQTLAEKCDTVWVPEYGREFWEKHRCIQTVDQMYHIAGEQRRRENSYTFLANQIMFCDTTPLTTTWYCRKMFGFQMFLKEYTPDAMILCQPDFPFVQDGTRNQAWVNEQYDFYLYHYKMFKGPKVMVSGPVSERVKQVLALAQA